jgi:hypothetical protein
VLLQTRASQSLEVWSDAANPLQTRALRLERFVRSHGLAQRLRGFFALLLDVPPLRRPHRRGLPVDAPYS